MRYFELASGLFGDDAVIWIDGNGYDLAVPDEALASQIAKVLPTFNLFNDGFGFLKDIGRVVAERDALAPEEGGEIVTHTPIKTRRIRTCWCTCCTKGRGKTKHASI